MLSNKLKEFALDVAFWNIRSISNSIQHHDAKAQEKLLILRATNETRKVELL